MHRFWCASVAALLSSLQWRNSSLLFMFRYSKARLIDANCLCVAAAALWHVSSCTQSLSRATRYQLSPQPLGLCVIWPQWKFVLDECKSEGPRTEESWVMGQVSGGGVTLWSLWTRAARRTSAALLSRTWSEAANFCRHTEFK